jgi:phenylalanyl-tRNA synthetase beta chain
MPTITVEPADYYELLGVEQTVEEFEKHLARVKGEFKGLDEDGCYRVELNDTNRPDLWSAAGIARQVRSALGKRKAYSFFLAKPTAEIQVTPSVESIRPYVAAFIVRDLNITGSSLTQIIQTQEKLAENFGRKRKDVAIGIYNLKKIKFPVHYKGIGKDQHSYVPLGFDEPMSLADILDKHPKGKQYRWILDGHKQVPLLLDANGLTLSMPPIINSRELGEVVVGDSDLFVEATGHHLGQVVLALNIMACDLADRGGRIERVRTIYPYDTPLGKKTDIPLQMDSGMRVPVSEFSRLLGIDVDKAELDDRLQSYGCDVRFEGQEVIVQPSPTRADYLHPVDVVEDFAIARGYDSFEPSMPSAFTIGRPDALSLLEDKARDVLIGMGYEELISNILFSKTLLREKMGWGDEPIVEIQNVMNENYSALRDSVLPGLLLAESKSATAIYPHRIFESGDVAIFDSKDPRGSATLLNVGGLVVHQEANLSDVHADLEYLFYLLAIPWELKETEHPSFLPGRSARILVKEQPVGWLGEIHPKVLENWSIGMPAAAFELSLNGWI